MMAIEMLESDPTFLSDESFFCTDFQTQSCDISTKLGSEPDLCWDTDMKEFWDSFETDFNNEPDFQVEVMSNKVESQTLPKTQIDPQIDVNYLNASAFLSPISIAPSSPTEQTVDNIEHPLELSPEMSFVSDMTDESLEEEFDSTSAMEILNKILSANSSDSENSQEECFDSAVNAVQYFANESNIAETRPQSSAEMVSNNLVTDFSGNNKRKRQVKRKIADIESESRASKGNKRSKVSLLEKKERKKDQNKSAANRYRIKKRAEQESIEGLQTVQEKQNDSLKIQLERLQMEFNVLYPLAEAAFKADPVRNPKLQLLHIRVLSNNLLD